MIPFVCGIAYDLGDEKGLHYQGLGNILERVLTHIFGFWIELATCVQQVAIKLGRHSVLFGV